MHVYVCVHVVHMHDLPHLHILKDGAEKERAFEDGAVAILREVISQRLTTGDDRRRTYHHREREAGEHLCWTNIVDCASGHKPHARGVSEDQQAAMRFHDAHSSLASHRRLEPPIVRCWHTPPCPPKGVVVAMAAAVALPCGTSHRSCWTWRQAWRVALPCPLGRRSPFQRPNRARGAQPARMPSSDPTPRGCDDDPDGSWKGMGVRPGGGLFYLYKSPGIIQCRCTFGHSNDVATPAADNGYGYGYILGPSPVPPIYLCG